MDILNENVNESVNENENFGEGGSTEDLSSGGWNPQPTDCCKYVVGNASDVNVAKDACEVKIDHIKVNPVDNKTRLYGYVVDCHGRPVQRALIKLLKKTLLGGFVGIAHTVSGCDGHYQFEVDTPRNNNGQDYRILVGKAATGVERTSGRSCNPCVPCP